MPYGLTGDTVKALSTIDDLSTLSRQSYVSPLDIAVVYTGIGDRDSAFEWLEKVHKDRSGPPYLKIDFMFGSLRSDPRFADFARRKGLAP